jgi:predicted AAA+ superfamily ATPase
MIKGDEGVRFENLVACSLLKHLNAIEDYEGRRAELKYLRTKEKKEVDFAFLGGNQTVRCNRQPDT